MEIVFDAPVTSRETTKAFRRNIFIQNVIANFGALFSVPHGVVDGDPERTQILPTMECDVSTGLRFHTAEILISFGIKSFAVIILGASPLAVLIFEVVLNGTAMFSHSNIKIPCPLDKLLRSIVVTPDMHRVHHSVDSVETNSNFGFNLSCWDFLFRTYRSQPAEGHEAMHIGLPQFRHASVQRLGQMLSMPFVAKRVGTTPQAGHGIDSNRMDVKARCGYRAVGDVDRR